MSRRKKLISNDKKFRLLEFNFLSKNKILILEFRKLKFQHEYFFKMSNDEFYLKFF